MAKQCFIPRVGEAFWIEMPPVEPAGGEDVSLLVKTEDGKVLQLPFHREHFASKRGRRLETVWVENYVMVERRDIPAIVDKVVFGGTA